MKNVCILLALFTMIFCHACAYSVHHIQTSEFDGAKPLDQARVVVASGEQFVILGLKTQSEDVDDAYQKLLNSCKGRITGITTKYSTDLGFLSWTNRIRIEGLCIE